jgi:threonine/homoserine/homoserine lactone efflux protein
MEIPIAMVLLSRVLKYKVNRWANIAAGAVMAIVQISSLFLGTAPTPSYIFFSVIEIAGLLFIVWSAWKWTNSEA